MRVAARKNGKYCIPKGSLGAMEVLYGNDGKES